MRLTNSPASCAECHGNLGAQISWNPLGHTGLTPLPFFTTTTATTAGVCGPQLVEALRYKPEGGGFDFPWGHR